MIYLIITIVLALLLSSGTNRKDLPLDSRPEYVYLHPKTSELWVRNIDPNRMILIWGETHVIYLGKL